ncbi:hypothetical protein CHL76_01365 [Marinococcus halophilus]|uniref:Glycosyltransferase 2-like domain-containing protein n=1 Tax=Marinococcus halophilus TaxID=1371 RepID=A0A510Y328_MARHA|nr:glycosyltransferase [Marinococcus halophilus]OZT81770.1 hypothetical protein CHL76_01365 [Marinococcus halophilus]GEK57730.1 hypothetical protein MHA01_06350 [Marinococcus halophilus]
MNPLVTIIMSTHNAEGYIDECLQSIAAQSYSDFTVYMIDDASTDSTAEKVKEFIKNDERFQLIDIHKQNRGLTPTLNELWKMAETKYVARMDADDVMHEERLEKQVQLLEKHKGLDVVGSYAMNINKDSEPIDIRKVPVYHKDVKKTLPLASPVIHPSAMIRRSALETVGGYNETYPVAQDYDLWFRLMGNGSGFHNIPETLLYYRMEAHHVKKRNIRHRWLDAKTRWRGTKLIGSTGRTKLVSLTVSAVMLGMPSFLKPTMMKLKEHIDPRYSKF